MKENYDIISDIEESIVQSPNNANNTTYESNCKPPTKYLIKLNYMWKNNNFKKINRIKHLN